MADGKTPGANVDPYRAYNFKLLIDGVADAGAPLEELREPPYRSDGGRRPFSPTKGPPTAPRPAR